MNVITHFCQFEVVKRESCCLIKFLLLWIDTYFLWQSDLVATILSNLIKWVSASVISSADNSSMSRCSFNGWELYRNLFAQAAILVSFVHVVYLFTALYVSYMIRDMCFDTFLHLNCFVGWKFKFWYWQAFR